MAIQISDARLGKLGGTPRKALDPEWNIQAAHRLWKRAGDFDDWPYCERAYDGSPSPGTSATPTPTPTPTPIPIPIPIPTRS